MTEKYVVKIPATVRWPHSGAFVGKGEISITVEADSVQDALAVVGQRIEAMRTPAETVVETFQRSDRLLSSHLPREKKK